jgi:type II secretory pathway pseudopilin PulG
MLTVIAIIGILAAIVAPSLSNWRKGDAIASGSRQMLDAVARARQLAISQRTTVFMVFVPTNFWNDPAWTGNPQRTPQDWQAVTNLADKQWVGYNYLALRSVGDQPGQGDPRYLSTWQVLPETTFIGPEKFQYPPGAAFPAPTNAPGPGAVPVYGFLQSTNLPFPRSDTRRDPTRGYVRLPYIAFNYLGQLTTVESDPEPLRTREEYIPVAHGRIAHSIDPATKLALLESPWVGEDSPSGVRTNTYQFIYVDPLTGRGHLIKRAVQ